MTTPTLLQVGAPTAELRPTPAETPELPTTVPLFHGGGLLTQQQVMRYLPVAEEYRAIAEEYIAAAAVADDGSARRARRRRRARRVRHRESSKHRSLLSLVMAASRWS
jgi:hypothetical protein